MKINERIITGYETEEYREVVPAVYDEEGNEIEPEQVVLKTRQIPVTAVVTRDMTEEEISELREQAPSDSEPTPDERLEAIEAAIIELAREVGSDG